MFFSQRAQVEMLIKDRWSLSAYLLFFKAELVSNTHTLRFIQQYIYGQTVTNVSFCRSEQKFNKASTPQFRATLRMYLNDRKEKYGIICHLSPTNTKQTNEVKKVLAFTHKIIIV